MERTVMDTNLERERKISKPYRAMAHIAILNIT